MQDNVIFFSTKNKHYKPSADESISEEVHQLISRFQDPDLPMKVREEIFNKIIHFTGELVGHKSD
ncbi:hypothetical protein FH966_07690 [Lentibacillus cibarius]|uniref:Uncharacterized protein n=1 Tax=Lentibacillus cibarius TaxID=2583219 RepID=A0A549YI81_9BACI|nr:hypothetical protein [Lentibacillus cibarius]TRM11587.1 hypothetical protein FH966_07690 [Lentibacillus cibarius]